MDRKPIRIDRQIRELVAKTPCGKGHECVESNFEKVTQVERAAGGEVLFCRGAEPRLCGHTLPFGGSVICLCPVRKHIAKHLSR